SVCTRAIKKLTAMAQAGEVGAVLLLVEYAEHGSLNGLREFAAARLAKQLSTSYPMLSDFFLEGLLDEIIRFWCLLGCIRTLGNKSYSTLLSVAMDPIVSHRDRVYAIRLLSIHSGQPFNRDCPRNADLWQESDLRLNELEAWKDAGCQVLESQPTLLQNPRFKSSELTAFDKVVAEFDDKLAKERNSDPEQSVNPANLLLPSADRVLETIMDRWQLPENYKHFLTFYSPYRLECVMQVRKLSGYLSLYSAEELIAAQEKFSTNPTDKSIHPEWKQSYVVIGDASLDPLIIDLNDKSGPDLPIYFAKHGCGEWRFKKLVNSFATFLNQIYVHYSDFEHLNVSKQQQQ
ncbi:MAG: SMI1/KNR4 family protein, partial [Candidatus Obscuribacter sp.]|nr:SMI1/KNR4 family protein [Candidatus Obscuribacter sp.]